MVEEAKGRYHLEYIQYYVERRWEEGSASGGGEKEILRKYTRERKRAYTYVLRGVYTIYIYHIHTPVRVRAYIQVRAVVS